MVFDAVAVVRLACGLAVVLAETAGFTAVFLAGASLTFALVAIALLVGF